MIEPGDINDKEILDATKQETNANGTFRFKIKLPTGQDLVSEWIRPERKREAMRAWLDTVRQSVAGAVQEKAAEKGRASREAKLKAERDKQMAELEADLDTVPVRPPAREQDTDCKPPELTAESDPVHHAKNQVALLEAEERHWLAESERATKHLATARDKLRKWKLIVASFEAVGEKDNGNS
jgi:hypothetical protein